MIQNERKENETQRALRITDSDGPRFVEVMVADEVWDVYILSQESM